MNKRLKRTISAVLASVIMLTAMTGTQVIASADSTSVTATVTAEKTYKITSKNVTTYLHTYNDKSKTKLYFMNGVTDVPYIEVSDMVSFLNGYLPSNGKPGYELKIKKDGDKVTLVRENNYSLEIDCENDTFFYWDYDGFFSAKSKTLIDFVMPTWDENSMMLKTDKATERYGNPVLLDAAYYGIDFVHKGSRYYIPLQTFSDMFLTPLGIASALYNGHSLIYYNSDIGGRLTDPEGKYTKLGQIYYGKDGKYATGKVSQELAVFSASEFCFAMDNLYGLKEKHHIDSFTDLVLQKESGFNLLNTNSKKIDRELYSIVNDVLDDVHSSFDVSSYSSGVSYADTLKKKYGHGYSVQNYIDNSHKLLDKRAEYYPNGVPAYEEIGDTAYITFDAFSLDIIAIGTLDFDDPSTIYGPITAMAYALQKINRENSPIKNVVLDLSCNGGGTVDTAVVVISAFLGKSPISIENAKTGALVTNYYKADTNFDGIYNSDDTLAGKGLNLYCLTSGTSFSCGNLVPCIFKEDPNVAIIGQKSGGGACAITHMSTATGSVLTLSSNLRLSYTKNGSFYDVDQGAEPDYAISKLEHFYDREWLTNYVDSLA